jgi:hypothetical protein
MPTLTGTDQNDNIIGSDTDDDIFGLAGNDQLTGNAGNDVIDGGSGDDILTGGSGFDILTGGTGVDRFRDTAAGLNGDRITDFLPGDRIQITDLTLQNANIGVVGSTITFNGGSVTVDNLGPGRLVVRAVQSGGIEIRLQGIPENDFDGDGFSDMLLRHDSGTLTTWLGTANGSFTDNWSVFNVPLPNEWQVAGTGDFNGDARSDMLLRHSSGTLTTWLGTANGSFTDNWSVFNVPLPTSWQIESIGDFNGDGRDDMLLRHTSGTLTNWLGTANGSFADNWGTFNLPLPNEWQVAGTGDFNGDGLDDMLLRHTSGTLTNWLGTANGSFADNWSVFNVPLPTSWQVAGIGDFNGDGLDDMLLRHDSGTLTNWLGTANGSFADNWSVFNLPLPNEWQVEIIGDFNGDGRDDMLLRHNSGTLTNWLGTANGSFADNWGVFHQALPTSWQVQPDSLL